MKLSFCLTRFCTVWLQLFMRQYLVNFDDALHITKIVASKFLYFIGFLQLAIYEYFKAVYRAVGTGQASQAMT